MNTIPVPSPPTDNLYKFLAIFGLVLLITGIVGMWRWLFHWQDTVGEAEVELSILKRNLTVIEEADDVNLEMAEELREGLSRLERMHSSAMKMKSRFSLVLAGSFGLQILGIGMMIVGFYAWHTRVQVLLDEKLQLEVEALREAAEQESAQPVATRD